MNLDFTTELRNNNYDTNITWSRLSYTQEWSPLENGVKTSLIVKGREENSRAPIPWYRRHVFPRYI